MTRLITEWISGIESEIKDYDENLKKKIGLDLAELAARSCGLELAAFREKISKHIVAVVPITAGGGVIGTFSESVAAILRVMGCNTFVTDGTDILGIAEGVQKGADILFMADDNAYISINVRTGKIGDNNMATAIGYVTALEKMAGTLKNKEVLVIGCGVVGSKAIIALKEKGAVVTVYDKDMNKIKDYNLGWISVLSKINDMKNFKYILDATNEGGWLHKGILADGVIISTPGAPLSLDEDTYHPVRERVVHDYLQIGTAVMLGLVL